MGSLNQCTKFFCDVFINSVPNKFETRFISICINQVFAFVLGTKISYSVWC